MSGLLHYDDFEGMAEQVAEDHPEVPGDRMRILWQECTVRRLVVMWPSKLYDPMSPSHIELLHEDDLSIAPIGVPVGCPHCGQTAIALDGYPWGFKKYGVTHRASGAETPIELRTAMVYCPHCDGGEDIG